MERGAMIETGPAELVKSYIESVWNRGELEALHRLTTPGFLYFLGSQPGRGHDEMENFVAATRTAFPDWRVVIDTVIAEGPNVAVRWSGTVTHEGEFHGILPTGKRIHVSGINVYQTEEGKIAAEWEQMDSVGMLRQLGMGG
jgi:steroid delta-isomerase-like uncharacterized protein